MENETILNENTIVNTVVEICDEVTTEVETIEQPTTKKIARKDIDDENESQEKIDHVQKEMYDEFNEIIERNTRKENKNEKKTSNNKRKNCNDDDKKKEGNETKMKTSKRIRR